MADANQEEVRVRFLKDISKHDVSILLDQGIHRSLLCKDPATNACHFYINTWPGYLSISGDMGTYVFSRLDDMFQFFRGTRINPTYWAEKNVASDGGLSKFSPQLLNQELLTYYKDYEIPSEDRVQVSLHASEYEAIADVCAKSWGQDFLSGGNFHKYTYHYYWICYAIQWAISQYDMIRARKDSAS